MVKMMIAIRHTLVLCARTKFAVVELKAIVGVSAELMHNLPYKYKLTLVIV